MTRVTDLAKATRVAAELKVAETLLKALDSGARIEIAVIETSGSRHVAATNRDVLAPIVSRDVDARIAALRASLAEMGVER